MPNENSPCNSGILPDRRAGSQPGRVSYHALRATSPTHVRKIALGFAQAKRAHPFQRVSQEFLDAVESNALIFIKDRIVRHPSKGKTLT